MSDHDQPHDQPSGIATVSSTAGTALVVATMWVLGLALVAGFAWATQVRHTAAVAGAGSSAGTAAPGAPSTATAGSPLAALTSGASGTTAAALDHLRAEERSEAAHALDAAEVLAAVGREVSAGPVRTAYVVAHHALGQARRSLWLGDPDAAVRHVEAARDALRGAGGEVGSATAPAPPPAQVWREYAGAQVRATDGEVLGRVVDLGDSGGEPTARLRLGEGVGVLGFWDVGADEVTVPLDALLFGQPTRLGTTHVVLVERP